MDKNKLTVDSLEELKDILKDPKADGKIKEMWEAFQGNSAKSRIETMFKGADTQTRTTANQAAANTHNDKTVAKTLKDLEDQLDKYFAAVHEYTLNTETGNLEVRIAVNEATKQMAKTIEIPLTAGTKAIHNQMVQTKMLSTRVSDKGQLYLLDAGQEMAESLREHF